MTTWHWTLATTITSIRDSVDLVGSTNTSDTTIMQWINQSLSDIYNMVMDANQDYIVSSQTITLVAGTQTYAVSTAFRKILQVHYTGGGLYYALDSFQPPELSSNTVMASFNDANLRYRIEGTNLVLDCAPNGAGTLTVKYVPEHTELTATSSTLPTWVQFGWHQYIIWDGAVRLRIKADKSPSAEQNKKDEAERNIRLSVRRRDLGAPQKMRDIYH